MYSAIVSRITTRPLPNADRLQIGTCNGYQVIVGMDVHDGDIGLFFEQGGQLGIEYANANDMIRRKLPDGTTAGGMFEANRRVRAITLRGVRSEGFFAPLSTLDFAGGYNSTLVQLGEQISTFNGVLICNKYVTPATRSESAASASHSRKSHKPTDPPMFPRHIETESLRKNVRLIPAGAVCYLTLQLHGTSFRYGHVEVTRSVQANWLGRLWRKALGKEMAESHFEHVNGTRNVVLLDGGGDQYRHVATRGITLRRNEVIYGELVGYEPSGKPIMQSQSTSGIKDKNVSRTFGSKMTYSYGQKPGSCAMYVYRVAYHGTELSWPQVQKRCAELGLNPVPEVERFIFDGDHDALVQRVLEFVNTNTGFRPSAVDPRHIEEGVVLRYEHASGSGWLKEKCYLFGVLEGYAKESDDYVDAEESA